ncbi:MAG: hypothetical protein HY291_18935, partial [Planctomycetes bacterium]|nr:hypothetical protein [Planctomycetota bacterium]
MSAKPITRIIDANANRAREGIRSAEDFIRFGIGEIRWSRRLKQIRHLITDTLKTSISAEQLAGSRNVGTDHGRPD